jgi:tetratricopeptide (TPR) repeat protein
MRHYFDEPMLFAGEGILRRRLTDPQAALQISLEAARRYPQHWLCQVAAMNAHADLKQLDEALDSARRASQLAPDDNSPLRDAAYAFLEALKPERAVEVLGELLQREPNYRGARAAFHFARFLAYQTDEDRRRCLELRERRAWDDRLTALASSVLPLELYQTFLPTPVDASVSAVSSLSRELEQVMHCCGQNASVSYTVTTEYLDSPSVATAFDLEMRALGGSAGKLAVHSRSVQTPDPRTEKAGVAYKVWTYQGGSAERVYVDADPRAQSAVSSIAVELYDLTEWDARAYSVAKQTGPDWLHAFFAVVTDPPSPPEGSGFHFVDWTYRCQVATALILSHLGEWSQGPSRMAACRASQRKRSSLRPAA